MKFIEHLKALNLLTKKVILILLSVLFIICIKFDIIDRQLSIITNKLYTSNELYLKESACETRELLLVLCSLQGGLEVLESSSIGIDLLINTNITLGNTITPLKDMTVIARNGSLIAISTLLVTELILSFFQKFSPILLIVILFLLMLQSFINVYFPSIEKQRKSLTNFAQKIFLLFLFCYLIFPLAIHFSAKISHFISKPIKYEVQSNFKEVYDDLSNNSSNNSLKEYAKNEIHHFEKIIIKLHHKVDKMMINATRHFAIMIFDCFILPIFIAGILYFYSHLIFYPSKSK